MTNKTPIPSITPMEPAMYMLLSAIKQNVEHMNGVSPFSTITPLKPTASTAEIITAVNALISRLG